VIGTLPLGAFAERHALGSEANQHITLQLAAPLDLEPCDPGFNELRFDQLPWKPVHRAKKLGHFGAIGVSVELHGLPVLQQLSQAHERDFIGHGHCLYLVVRDVEHRGPELFGEVPDLAAHILSEAGVQIAERLVHEEDFRVDRNGSCQGHPLLLATAQQGGRTVRLLVELHHVQGLLDPCSDFSTRDLLGSLP